MRIADMNWMQVRDHAARDDRAVLPIGSTEQHAYLSLAVDAILSERVRVEAAEPLGIPVFPVDQLRADAELRRISRNGDAQALDAVRGRHATCSTASCAPASGAS